MSVEPNRPKRRKSKKKKKRLNFFRIFLLVFIIGALVVTGSVAGFVMVSLQDIPAWDPKALEMNLPTYIYDKDEKLVTKIYIENRDPIDIEQVPDRLINAFLAIEDVRFYDHNGVDLKRIVGAAIADIKEGSMEQGASTITQQLVKKSFLSPEKKFKRKIQEAVLAMKLERKYTKDEILEMYLNRIYLGHGAYGIRSAAEIYFGKTNLDRLDLEEVALLAGLPQAPSAYDPYKNPERAKKRRNVVLDMMAKYDFISQEEAEKAKKKDIKLGDGTDKNKNGKYPYPYFVDYVTDQLLSKYTEAQVFKGGLKVYTTLDTKIQSFVEKAVANKENFPKSTTDKNGLVQPQAAVVILDPHTGHIKALVGGREHTQKLSFNRATDAKRQPGSSFKPIIAYGPAIEKGKGSGSVVLDEPVKFGNYEPHNYNEDEFRGPITLREAITHSVNVAAVKLLDDNGISYATKFAKKLGITSLTDADKNLAMALGGLHYGVTPLEMAGAYGAFANNGAQVEPIVITKVEDRMGHVIDTFTPKKKVAMKETTAFIMTDMMQSVVKSGTGWRAQLGKRPVAGKTGTTSDSKDIWFAGYTPELVGIVWMGHDEPKPMSRSFGGKYPAMIWKEVMSQALKDVKVKDFERPTGLVRATVCSQTGMLPGENCSEDHLVTEWFVKGTQPNEICDNHVLVEVCADSGLLPNEYCPDTIIKPFLKRDDAHKDTTLDYYEPIKVCDIHGVDNSTISICTHPAHGGQGYLANIPKRGEAGGCPEEYIIKQDKPAGESPPLMYCPIPEHQVYPKQPENPVIPDSPENSIPDTPVNPSDPDSPENPSNPNKPDKPKDNSDSNLLEANRRRGD